MDLQNGFLAQTHVSGDIFFRAGIWIVIQRLLENEWKRGLKTTSMSVYANSFAVISLVLQIAMGRRHDFENTASRYLMWPRASKYRTFCVAWTSWENLRFRIWSSSQALNYNDEKDTNMHHMRLISIPWGIFDRLLICSKMRNGYLWRAGVHDLKYSIKFVDIELHGICSKFPCYRWISGSGKSCGANWTCLTLVKSLITVGGFKVISKSSAWRNRVAAREF